MLKLNKNDITLSQSATDKFAAIKNIAQSLTDKGLVEQGYVEGMLNRENQNSRFWVTASRSLTAQPTLARW